MTAPTRQPLPRNPDQARTELPYWADLARLARIKAEVAKRELDLACNDLRVVEGIANGEFSDNPPIREEIGYLGVRPVRTYAVGSHGAWAV